MTEQDPHPEPGPTAPEKPANAGIWDPDEQVGDIYAVEMDDQGQVVRADKLTADPDDRDPTETEHLPRPQPSIWVGSWLDYNNGVLHGQWITADRDDAELWTDIQAMLAGSPTARATGEVAEDWGIFDHENFGGLRIGEQETVSWVAAVARGIATHGLAFAVWAEVMDDAELLGGFEDSYLGHYESVEQYAEQVIADHDLDTLLDQVLPPSFRPYVRIDSAAMARDWQMSGELYAAPADDGGVWLFDTTK